MAPEFFSEGPLIQLRDTDSVFVRLHMLGHDVHGHLCQKQVCAYPCRRGDASGVKHLTDHGHHQFVCGQVVCIQVVRGIRKDFIDAVNNDVLRADVL